MGATIAVFLFGPPTATANTRVDDNDKTRTIDTLNTTHLMVAGDIKIQSPTSNEHQPNVTLAAGGLELKDPFNNAAWDAMFTAREGIKLTYNSNSPPVSVVTTNLGNGTLAITAETKGLDSYKASLGAGDLKLACTDHNAISDSASLKHVGLVCTKPCQINLPAPGRP